MNADQPQAQERPVETAAVELRMPAWKRALDIALVIVALPVLLPLMLGIALVIRLVSAGPILFKQERIGLRGRPFMCFKFRTMVAGTETNSHQGHLNNLMTSGAPMVKMDAKGDPRIIRFGLPLRVTGLDELPQILNILRGEMSLVGPRPCVRYEFDKYLPWQRERFDTVPGLTGLWQVSGKNRTTFEEMMHLDIRYVRTKTLWLDCFIILKTVPALMVQVYDTRMARKKARALAAGAERAAAPRPIVKPAVIRPAFTAFSARIGDAKTQEEI